mgnify:FL=1
MAGKLYKRKDGYWYYKYSFINEFGFSKWRMISCKTKDDEVAVRVKNQYDKTFGELKNPFSNPKFTYLEMKTEYLKTRLLKVKRGQLSDLTYKSDCNSLNRFGEWLLNKYGSEGYVLGDINHKLVQKFIDDRLDEVSTTTIDNNLKHLSSFMGWCLKKDFVKVNPVMSAKLDKPKRKKRKLIPSKDEWSLLWKHLETKVQRFLDGEEEYDFFSMMIFVQMNLGLRIGEVLGMKWNRGSDDNDTGHSKNYIYLSDDNNKLVIYFKRRLRTIPTSSINYLLDKIPTDYRLRKWVNTSTDKKKVKMKYVFGNPYTNEQRYSNQISRDFKKLMRELNLNSNYTTHSLRHGWAVNQIRNNSNIYTISKFMGHSMVQVTEIYADHLVSDDFDELVLNNKPKE